VNNTNSATLVTTAAGTANQIIPGYYVLGSPEAQNSDFAKNHLPTKGAITPIPAPSVNTLPGNFGASASSVEARQFLFTSGNAQWKEVQCYTPMIRYDLIDSIAAAKGIDVSLGFGYKMFINGGLYLHPSVHFAYFNAQSKNALQTGYEEAKFYIQGVNAQCISTTETAIPEGPINDLNAITRVVYTIDPDTQVSQGLSGSIVNALTYATQWYWRFVTAIGYQINEGVSVEALVGYQMTRCKLSLLEASGTFTSPLKDYIDPQAKSPLLSAIAITDGATAYNFKENVSPVEEAQARMISGVVIGFGMNFNLAQNLSMGVQLTNVYNMKRNYTIENVLVSPSVEIKNTTDAAKTEGTTTTETSQNAEPAVTTFNANMVQHQTGVSVNFTYLLPVGGECNPAA